MTDDVSTRRASPADFPNVLELARRALGWTDADARFLEWKHRENAFGESPMWVAESDGAIVGFRTFLRWELSTPNGQLCRAVRAVDTATDPAFQGRGIFTRLTLGALDELRAEGVELVFNTPNDQSLPGYLKMGWSVVGRLPVEIRPNHWRFPLVVGGARRPAQREAVPTTVGEPAIDVLGGDAAQVRALIASGALPEGLSTRRSPEYLTWRYGNPELAYRVVTNGSIERGVALFRLRRRGSAVEAVVDDVIVPSGDRTAARHLLAGIGRSRADYLIRLGSTRQRQVARGAFVRVPRIGPVLACRPLDDTPAPPLSSWALTLGDVELL